MSSLVSRAEIFCWVLAGRRSRSLRLLVGQIRVSVQKARTSLSWSRQNSSRVRPGRWAVELRGPGIGRTSARPTRVAWRNSLISGSAVGAGIAGRSVSRASCQAWITPAQRALGLLGPRRAGVRLRGVGEVSE